MSQIQFESCTNICGTNRFRAQGQQTHAVILLKLKSTTTVPSKISGFTICGAIYSSVSCSASFPRYPAACTAPPQVQSMKTGSVGKICRKSPSAAHSLSFLQQQLNEFLLSTCRRSSISPSHDAPVQPPAQNQSQQRKMKLHKAGVKFPLTEVGAFYLNPFILFHNDKENVLCEGGSELPHRQQPAATRLVSNP